MGDRVNGLALAFAMGTHERLGAGSTGTGWGRRWCVLIVLAQTMNQTLAHLLSSLGDSSLRPHPETSIMKFEAMTQVSSFFYQA